jgi:hypothetical protein
MRPVRVLVVAVPAAFLFFRLLGSTPAEQTEELGRFRFVDVAAEAGITVRNVSGDPRRWYIPESNGNGAAWLDYDSDGDQDLFVGNGQGLAYHDDGARLEVVREATSRLYRNEGFLRFADVSMETGTDRRDWVNAVAVGDVDSDGDPDLYLGCFGSDVLLRKEGNRYVDATKESGLANELWAAGAAFGDADRDGDLDLYVANYCRFDLAAPPAGGKRNVIDGVEIGWGPEEENKLGYNAGAPDAYFVNDGKGRFREQTAAAGFALEKARCSYACVWSDVTGDGWVDLLVANDLQPANLFVSQRDGRFRDEALARGFALNAEGKATAGMGLLVEDVDGDGDQDVLRTNFDMEANCLHVNDGKGNFQDKAGAYGLAASSMDKLGWGGAFFDADRDGDLDLVVANGHVLPQGEKIGLHGWLMPTQLFEGVPHRTYGTVWQEVTAEAGPGLAPPRSARGVAIGDPDDDGDHDVLIVDLDEPPRLLRNDGPKVGHWIGLDLRGRFSNRDAYGALVTIRAGEQRWTREVRATNGLYSSHDRRVLVGLGDATQVDGITVRWPNGELQELGRLPIDRYHVVDERIETR